MDARLRRTRRGALSIVEPVAEADELELLARIAAGDRVAMREFYLLYHRRLARFLARITSRRELVDEIINDTLLIVWRRAAQFRGGSRVSTWVMGIAWRHGLKTSRRERRAAEYPAAPEMPAALEAQAFENRDTLEHALQPLSAEHRAALELAYVGGYSCDEIGAIMGCPANTVKTRLFYARRRVRDALAEASLRTAADGAPPVTAAGRRAADPRTR